MPPEELQLLAADLRAMALLGSGLVLASLAFMPILMRIVDGLFPGPEAVRAPWGLVEVALAVGLYLVVTFLTILGVQAYMGDQELGALPALILTAAGQGLVAVFILLFVRRSVQGRRALGFGHGVQWRGFLSGLAIYFLCLPGLFGLMILNPFLLDLCGVPFEPQEIGLLIGEAAREHMWAILFLAVLVVPLLEELIFRGFLLPAFVQAIGVVPGLFVTSALFAVLHGMTAFVPIFGLALLLGLLMLRTRRLAVVWAVHAMNNALAMSLVFLRVG